MAPFSELFLLCWSTLPRPPFRGQACSRNRRHVENLRFVRGFFAKIRETGDQRRTGNKIMA